MHRPLSLLRSGAMCSMSIVMIGTLRGTPAWCIPGPCGLAWCPPGDLPFPGMPLLCAKCGEQLSKCPGRRHRLPHLRHFITVNDSHSICKACYKQHTLDVRTLGQPRQPMQTRSSMQQPASQHQVAAVSTAYHGPRLHADQRLVQPFSPIPGKVGAA